MKPSSSATRTTLTSTSRELVRALTTFLLFLSLGKSSAPLPGTCQLAINVLILSGQDSCGSMVISLYRTVLYTLFSVTFYAGVAQFAFRTYVEIYVYWATVCGITERLQDKMTIEPFGTWLRCWLSPLHRENENSLGERRRRAQRAEMARREKGECVLSCRFSLTVVGQNYQASSPWASGVKRCVPEASRWRLEVFTVAAGMWQREPRRLSSIASKANNGISGSSVLWVEVLLYTGVFELYAQGYGLVEIICVQIVWLLFQLVCV